MARTLVKAGCARVVRRCCFCKLTANKDVTQTMEIVESVGEKVKAIERLKALHKDVRQKLSSS